MRHETSVNHGPVLKCTVCGGEDLQFGSSLTADCCGKPIDPDMFGLIGDGKLDFIKGKWRVFADKPNPAHTWTPHFNQPKVGTACVWWGNNGKLYAGYYVGDAWRHKGGTAYNRDAIGWPVVYMILPDTPQLPMVVDRMPPCGLLVNASTFVPGNNKAVVLIGFGDTPKIGYYLDGAWESPSPLGVGENVKWQRINLGERCE